MNTPNAPVKEKVTPPLIKPCWVEVGGTKYLLYMASDSKGLTPFFRSVGSLGAHLESFGVQQGARGLQTIDECLRRAGIYQPTPETSYVAEQYCALVFTVPELHADEFRQLCSDFGFPHS